LARPMSMRRWVRPATTPIMMKILRDLIILGLNHEQQHQELILTDIKHAFLLQSAAAGLSRAQAPALHPSRKLEWREHPGRLSRQSAMTVMRFAFDNEGPRHGRAAAFQFPASPAAPVSNGEYQTFIADGRLSPTRILAVGRLGRACRRKIGRRPLYWLKDDDGSAREKFKPVHTVGCAAARSATRLSSM